MSRSPTRWEPFAELVEMRSRMDRLFDDWLDEPKGTWTPPIDVVREDGHLVMRADLPGIKPDEVRIEVEDGTLTVSGEHRETIEEKHRRYMRRERRYGSFHRSLPLPGGIDPATIKARTHDGIVEVTIPLPAEMKKEPITIEAVHA